MNTGYISMGSTNSQASNIPLPPRSPPPFHQQQHQQQPHQHHQQQQQQHHQQQQQPTPIFGATSQPLSFESLARARENINVVESTLHQYGPGLAMPMQNAMSHMVHNRGGVMPNISGPHQPIYIRPHQQQHQIQQQHQQMNLQSRMVFHQQPNQQYQSMQRNLTNQNTMIQHNSVQNSMARPPAYLTNNLPVHCQPSPVASIPTYHISPSPVSSSSSTTPSQSNNTVISLNVNDTRSTSPDASISPPLDAIRGANVPTNTIITPPEMEDKPTEEKNDAPKEEKDLMTQVKENWEKWTVNQMIQEYRSLGKQLESAQSERAGLEKEINDVVRKNPGQNVELNPVFLKKKSELKVIGRKCEDINRAIKFVGEKSLSKYGRTLENSNMRQPLQNAPPPSQPVKKIKAKMSTAAPPPTAIDKNPKDKKDILLDLRDGNLWCQACDDHFSSLKEYCLHLHRREHLSNAERTSQPPWRHNDVQKRQLGRFETLGRLKSICASVNDTTDTEFSLRNLDTVLNPSLKDREEIKQLQLKRERKQFDDNDKLFTLKGYDEIVPVSGYFCKLCDRTLCDEKEVEIHIKGWTHNYEHAKSVALQSSHEREFRIKMEKSLKALKASEKPKEVVSKSIEAPTRLTTIQEDGPCASNGLSSHWSARLPYKKPTSKIVDEHDVIADRFEKRKDKDSSETRKSDASEIKKIISSETKKQESSGTSRLDPSKSSKSSPPSSRSPKKQRDRSIPEIVPVSENQPSASLKRLKRDKVNEKSKDHEPEKDDTGSNKTNLAAPVIVESCTEDEAVKNQNSTVMLVSSAETATDGFLHLERGDPDSPFPNFDLYITGNHPVTVLKDERLGKYAKVKMNRIDLEDYKEMLLDSSSLWARVDKLMTKKEPGEFEKNLDTVTLTAPCFFGQDGQNVPVSIERDDSDEGEGVEFKMNMLEEFFCSS